MLSEYIRKELIGSGTFGNVFIINSKSDGQIYVLKEIKLANMSANEKQLALTEVKVLSTCKHNNIIRYKDAMFDQPKSMLYIVMEYAEYGDMSAAIKKQEGVYFPEKDVLSWFVQITLALQYIHNHNIVHRDLKTQNIFLTGNKMIKVGDFGIARVLKDHELATTVIGTPFYVSPEICQKKPYNYKSDIWALGCVLFEMSALIHPFQGLHLHQLINCIMIAKYRKLPSHCSALTQDLVSVLLNPAPEKRPTASEILAIPKLQPHLYEYIDTFSTPESFGVIDILPVALAKKNNSRRLSSDDVMGISRQNAAHLKRTASVYESATKPKKMSKTNTPKTRLPHVSAMNLHAKKLSHREAVDCNKANDHETKKSTQAYPTLLEAMKKTYVLSKIFGKGKKNLPEIESKGKLKDTNGDSHRSKSTNETDADIGYQSGSTSTQIVINEPVRKVSKKHSLPLVTCDEEFCMSDKLVSDFCMPKLEVNDDDDVFDELPRKLNCLVPQIRCQHSIQCQCCLYDTLWKNRIKSTGGIDDAEKDRLRTLLQEALGKKKFEDIYLILSHEWNSQCRDETPSIQCIIQNLNCEQRQYVPLLLQFLQLNLIKNLPY